MVSVNTLYNVGARDEDPSLTGFAHLFEHLMFGGTKKVPDYDMVVTQAGGESNAFTNNDYTDYYITLPAKHLEVALMLESDRMQGLDLTQKALEVQQSVVTEEYNYRYVNQPYGDMWLLLRPLCYKVHPYRWCTIGADIRHVQQATLADVKDFFARYYCPSNAILAVVGNVKRDEVVRLVEKYYGGIAGGAAAGRSRRQCPAEPLQTERRVMEVRRNVPSNALYVAFHTDSRVGADFAAADLISDILGNGDSARLYQELVKRKGLFAEIDACVTGDTDPGLFLVSGKMKDGVGYDEALQAVEEQLDAVARRPVPEEELQKVVNKYESTFAFSQYKAIDCAMGLCYYERLGRLEWVNSEPQIVAQTTPDDIARVAGGMFAKEQWNVLKYVKES